MTLAAQCGKRWYFTADKAGSAATCGNSAQTMKIAGALITFFRFHDRLRLRRADEWTLT
jgi:hypothetical protein